MTARSTWNPLVRRTSTLAALAGLALAMAVSVALVVPPAEATEDANSYPAADNPVIFTTPQEVDRMVSRVDQAEEPFYTAWQRTKSEADAALEKEYVPEQSDHHGEYFDLARVHARDVRNLALAYHVTGEQEYASKGREILGLWAEDALASTYPSRGSPHSAGLVIGRAIPIFADGYALLYSQLPQGERDQVDAWFQKMVAPIKQSRDIWETAEEICIYGECHVYEKPWLGGQKYNNHLAAQNLGLMAIGFATNDEELIAEAKNGPDNPRHLEELIEGVIIMEGDELFHEDPTYVDDAPAAQDGEVYDRYRARSNDGLQYAYLALRVLTLQVDIVSNNYGSTSGPYDFAWTAPGGENLELPFAFYSEFYVTGDPGARTGYYADSRLADPEYFAMPLYEIGAREYPDNAEIKEVLQTLDRVHYDNETFGWTLVLTDGVDGIESS